MPPKSSCSVLYLLPPPTISLMNSMVLLRFRRLWVYGDL